MNETQQTGTRPPGSDWWSRRPRRSRQDSKVAGVAGGLGRYFGVDPVLFRVGFVVMTIFGGIGVLTYCLAWLLLPADGDEVSAAESLIGRGRSSVPPILAVGLALAAMISVASSFSWGLPFWPVVIVATIAFVVARKRRSGPFRPGSDWEQRMRSAQQHWGGSNSWSGHGGSGSAGASGSSGWGGHNWSNWGGGCGSKSRTDQSVGQSGFPSASNPSAYNPSGSNPSGSNPTGSGPTGSSPAGYAPWGSETPAAPSPFDTPAFWDETPSNTGGVDMHKSAAPTDSSPIGAAPSGAAGFGGTQFAEPQFPSSQYPSAQFPSSQFPSSQVPAQQSPPSWDPLGAAPFAWDLPDIEVAQPGGSTAVAVQRKSSVVARVTMGVALLVGALAAFGVVGGWWMMSWAMVSASVLAVIALGLLVGAIRGRGHALIGHGIFFSVLTLALSVTGISGTDGYGDIRYAPTQISQVQASWPVVNAGNGTLDLSGLTLTEGQTVTTEFEVRAGQGIVVLPEGVNVEVTCVNDAGNMDCLGEQAEGLRNERTVSDKDPDYTGTIVLNVQVNAGDLEVSRG